MWRARSRSGCFLFSRRSRRFAQMPFGRFLFSRRLRRFAQMPFGRFLFSHRLRRFAQMPFGALLVSPQIAQICTDAVRGASCFPADCADLHRCRSGRANPADRAQARQMPQMPFGVLLVFPQIAQICTDAVRGGLIPQIAPRRGRCHRCRSGASCFPTDCADLHRCRSGVSCFPTQIAPLAPRSKREFCYNVTCYMLQ